MAYTAWSVVYGEQPTAAKWNQLGANDAGFRDGSNIDDDALIERHYSAGSVTHDKIDHSTFPVFAAYLSSGQNITNTIAALQFNTELIDTMGGFNTSNYTYTVPVGEGGLWEIFIFLADGDADSTRRVSELLVNGSTSYRGSQYITTYGDGFLMQPIMLNAGDTLLARGQANPSATISLTGGVNGSKFWGKRVA